MAPTKKDVAPPVDKSYQERDALVESCKLLAFREAHRFWRRNKDLAELEDFQQAAFVALIEAANRFHQSRKLKFVTYATYCIHGQLIQFFRLQSLIRVPWKVPTEMVRKTIAKIIQIPISDEGDTMEFGDPRTIDLAEQFDRQAEREMLHRAMAENLKPRSVAILEARFPSDSQPKTLDQLSQELGIGKERVRQIEKQSLQVLYRCFDADFQPRKNKKKRKAGRLRRMREPASGTRMLA
jgi:RNA polymerase sigma factor (sigma-70 family)